MELKNLKEVCSRYKLDLRVENFGKSIVIDEKDSETYIYMRITPRAVEISNIVVDEKRRKCGIFSSIVDALKYDYSDRYIQITNILTEDMLNFCEKRNYILDYYNEIPTATVR